MLLALSSRSVLLAGGDHITRGADAGAPRCTWSQFADRPESRKHGSPRHSLFRAEQPRSPMSMGRSLRPARTSAGGGRNAKTAITHIVFDISRRACQIHAAIESTLALKHARCLRRSSSASPFKRSAFATESRHHAEESRAPVTGASTQLKQS